MNPRTLPLITVTLVIATCALVAFREYPRSLTNTAESGHEATKAYEVRPTTEGGTETFVKSIFGSTLVICYSRAAKSGRTTLNHCEFIPLKPATQTKQLDKENKSGNTNAVAS